MGGPPSPAPLVRRGSSPLVRIAQAFVRTWLSRGSLVSFLGGAVLAGLIKKLCDMWLDVKKRQAESCWRSHVDFSTVQACVFSTELLERLGRVEKRTLFVKPITEVFRNEYIRTRLMEAAEKAAASSDPVLLTKLSDEDKWHVLNTCTNEISSVFAPYHIFFNEARRHKSHYKSAWYCFTLTCSQTEATGRWFITPFNPVGMGDCGSLRIRICLMNEQELRDIASGALEPPEAMFNGRHESRWQICSRFAELFNRQLTKVTGDSVALGSTQQCPSTQHLEVPRSPSDPWNMVGQRWEDWGKTLGGGLGRRKPSWARVAGKETCPVEAPAYEPEDNSILRIHIPFPASRQPVLTPGGACVAPDQLNTNQECIAKDVVLFE